VQLVTLPGAFMFFATGAILIEAWKAYGYYEDKQLIAGVLAIMNGFVYLVDFALICYGYRLTQTS
jgi:hypothetical protein